MIRYVRKSDCETIVLDDETMILNPSAMTVTRINDTGLFCWSQLSEPHTFEMLSASIRERFGTSEADARQDLSAFLNRLLECGLIETGDE